MVFDYGGELQSNIIDLKRLQAIVESKIISKYIFGVYLASDAKARVSKCNSFSSIQLSPA